MPANFFIQLALRFLGFAIVLNRNPYTLFRQATHSHIVVLMSMYMSLCIILFQSFIVSQLLSLYVGLSLSKELLKTVDIGSLMFDRRTIDLEEELSRLLFLQRAYTYILLSAHANIQQFISFSSKTSRIFFAC